MFVNNPAYGPAVVTTRSSETLLAIEDRRVNPLPALPDPWNRAPAKISSFVNLVVDVPVEAFATDVAAAAVTSSGAT